MKYTISMKMERKEIMELHNLIGDLHKEIWGFQEPQTDKYNIEWIDQLCADICNWLVNSTEISGMDLVMLDHVLRETEMRCRKLCTELEKIKFFEKRSALNRELQSIREVFSMDRSW